MEFRSHYRGFRHREEIAHGPFQTLAQVVPCLHNEQPAISASIL